MEAFSDAVFAIAITLPIVEVRMPEIKQGDPVLAQEFLRLWPSFVGYGLSFLVIGLYWVHHHFNGMIFRRVTHGFLLSTLLFLMAIGFVAFPTHLFAQYVHDPVNRHAATAIYVGSLTIVSLTWLVKWLHGVASRAIDDRLRRSYVRRMTIQYVATSAAYVIAFLVTLVSWAAGLTIAFAITLYYLRPPPAPEYL